MTAHKRQRIVLIALVVSVLLNVFLTGFIAARFTFQPHHGQGPRSRHQVPRGRAMRALIDAHREELRGRRKAVHRARRAVRDALVAEPFEVDTLATTLANLRSVTTDAQQALHDALVKTAPALSPQERAALSRAHRLWSGSGGRRRHHRAGPPGQPPAADAP